MTKRRNVLEEKCVVYFVQLKDDSTAPIKIGRAINPFSRLQTLQTAHWRELHILGVILHEQGKAAVRQEERLKVQFESASVRGEWFHPVPELLAFIRENAQSYDDERSRLQAEVAGMVDDDLVPPMKKEDPTVGPPKEAT